MSCVHVGSVTALTSVMFCMHHYISIDSLEFVFGLVLTELLTSMPNTRWAYALLKTAKEIVFIFCMICP